MGASPYVSGPFHYAGLVRGMAFRNQDWETGRSTKLRVVLRESFRLRVERTVLILFGRHG